MTAHRRPGIPFSDAPRGECRWCGEAILHETGPQRGEPNRRRRWHPTCLDAYEGTDPREARRRIRKRDRGICAACGVDTYALRRELRGRGMSRALRRRGFKPRQSLWELDHIVPLIDGGGHDDTNLQTLCTPCHKEKSAREARERSLARGCEPPAPADPTSQPEACAQRDAPASAPAADRPPRREPARRPAAPSLEALIDEASRLNARVEALLRDYRASTGH